MSISKARLEFYFHPYYIINSIIILSYFFWREKYIYKSAYLREETSIRGLNKEGEYLILAVITLAIRYRKMASIAKFVDLVFLYLKVLVMALLFFLDKRLCVWYLIIYLFIYLLIPTPIYHGPSKIISLDFVEFEKEVIRNRNYTWLIEFDCSWSPASQYLAADYADISNRYTTETLKFGKIDLTRYTNLADKYKIDISGSSWQLPTFILFKNGKEIRRLPDFAQNGEVMRVVIDKKSLEICFELGRLEMESMSSIDKKNE